MSRLMTIVLLVLVAALLVMLRPQLLGGNASFVTVQQGDLEPLLYKDDLAVVKRDPNYEFGQLIAVDSQQGPYFGRILGQEDETYIVRVFAGADPIAVPKEYIFGRLWFNLGDFGRRISAGVLDQFGIKAETAR